MNNTALLFPGQGSQFIGMGKDLADSFPLAMETIQEVDEVLQFNLSKMMFYGDHEELTLTINAQPAIMAVSIAAMRVLCQQLSTSPAQLAIMAAGHSLGEYSALCTAGVFSLSQTSLLLKARGQAMQEAVPQGCGSMLALLNAEETNAQMLTDAASAHGRCEIANDNGAGQFVLSGDVNAIEYALENAKNYDIKRAIKLNVSAPFHSSMMQPAAEKMRAVLDDQSIHEFTIPVVANFTAEINTDTNLVKELLVNQVCGKVRWRQTMDYMNKRDVNKFIEFGPGKVLTTLAKRILPDSITYNIHDPKDLDLYCNSI